MVVLSNAKSASVQSAGQGISRTSFNQSPVMSPYMLSVCVGHLQGVSRQTAGGINMTVWSVPQWGAELDTAIQV